MTIRKQSRLTCFGSGSLSLDLHAGGGGRDSARGAAGGSAARGAGLEVRAVVMVAVGAALPFSKLNSLGSGILPPGRQRWVEVIASDVSSRE